jgi:hypothetical protein
MVVNLPWRNPVSAWLLFIVGSCGPFTDLTIGYLGGGQ